MENDEDKECDEVVDKKTIEQIKVAEKEKVVDDVEDNESDRSMNGDSTRWGKYVDRLTEMPRSRPIGYYLKHEINKETIEDLVEKLICLRKSKSQVYGYLMSGFLDEKCDFSVGGEAYGDCFTKRSGDVKSLPTKEDRALKVGRMTEYLAEVGEDASLKAALHQMLLMSKRYLLSFLMAEYRFERIRWFMWTICGVHDKSFYMFNLLSDSIVLQAKELKAKTGAGTVGRKQPAMEHKNWHRKRTLHTSRYASRQITGKSSMTLLQDILVGNWDSLRCVGFLIKQVCDALLEGKMAPTKEKGRKLREHIDDTSIKLGHAEKFLKEVLDVPFDTYPDRMVPMMNSGPDSDGSYFRKEKGRGHKTWEAREDLDPLLLSNDFKHAFDMVSIDAFKTGKKHPDVRYVLSSVIASICMFVRLLMSDDAAIVMLPVWESGLLADIMEESKCVLILWKLAFSDQNGSWHRVSKSPPEQVGGAVGYAASKYVQTDRLTAKSDLWTSGAVLE
ncbi:hypothetical protein Tco_0339497 [Tanacetum coccineum]